MSGNTSSHSSSALSESVIRFLRSFTGLLYPRLCLLCGNDLPENQQCICHHCYLELPRTKFEQEKNNRVEQIFWGRVPLEKASSFLFFRKGEQVQKILHHIKYKGNMGLAREMGRLMAEKMVKTGFCKDIDLIMAVPLHSKKQKQRGFNQSELLAEGFSEISMIPMLNHGLHRTSFTYTQTHKGRYERFQNMDGMFYVSNKTELRGKSILLFDDIVTSGSTIEACANELLKVEGVRVSVATLAFADLD